MISTASQTSEELLSRFATGDYSAAEGCPFNTIRATNAEGEEVWVGGLGTRRWPFDELEGEEKENKVKAMLGRKADDPDLLRTLGFYLDPVYQGQGIMKVVLRTLLQNYLVPICEARRIRSTVYVGNWASRKTFERAGFVMRKTNWVNAGESRGGMMKEEWWMEWMKSDREVLGD